MVKPMTNQTNGFIWYELLTADPSAAAAFYGTVSGWSSRDAGTPGMDYVLFSVNGTDIAGMMALPPGAAGAGMHPGWLGYIGVEDVDKAVAALTAAGGTVHMPSTDIPGVGRFAMVADPQGAPFYVMRGDSPEPSAAFRVGVPGHGGWHELHTTDWKAAFTFYADQFGWAQSDAMDMGPMGTYLIFNAGGVAIGGMMNSPDFPRPSWLYYFNVDDIDAALGRITAAGGRVLNGPEEVPGGIWIIQAEDPQGAMFAIVGPRIGKGA